MNERTVHNDRTLWRLGRYKLANVPLWVIAVCGICGVLVDIDHLAPALGIGNSYRLWHIPLGYISGAILCGVIAYIARLYFKVVLSKMKCDICKKELYPITTVDDKTKIYQCENKHWIKVVSHEK